MKTTRTIRWAQTSFGLLCLSILAFSSCKKNAKTPAAESTQNPTPEQTQALDSYFVATAHENPAPIASLLGQVEVGQELVLHGEIMGKVKPLSDTYAVFTLGDPEQITPCNRRPDDTCPTPWDNCCDSPTVVRKSIASVQLVNDQGDVIRAPLRGQNGLEELSYVTIKGTVATGSQEENLIINAQEVHVAQESPYADAQPAIPTVGLEQGAEGEEAHDHDHDHENVHDHENEHTSELN